MSPYAEPLRLFLAARMGKPMATDVLSTFRCFWPGCQCTFQSQRFMCDRHYAMLPERLRNWFNVTRPRGANADTDAKHRAARFACIAYGRSHPDPLLPPFAVGQMVKLRVPDMFDESGPVAVRSVFLNSQNKWQVFLANDDLLPASDVEAAPNQPG